MEIRGVEEESEGSEPGEDDAAEMTSDVTW